MALPCDIFFHNDLSLIILHFLKADMFPSPFPKGDKILRSMNYEGPKLEMRSIILQHKVPRTTENPPWLIPVLVKNRKPFKDLLLSL